MLKFYYNTAPNPMKVALFFEEAGLEYEAIPVDSRQGDQFKPDYVAINPNSKAPSIVDDGHVVFDSNAILLYLGEKTGKFMPAYTIVDMCVWGWARMVPLVIGEGELEKRGHLHRLVEEINARPAAERALTIKDRQGHAFKTEMDAEARKFMFPQNARLAG